MYSIPQKDPVYLHMLPARSTSSQQDVQDKSIGTLFGKVLDLHFRASGPPEHPTMLQASSRSILNNKGSRDYTLNLKPPDWKGLVEMQCLGTGFCSLGRHSLRGKWETLFLAKTPNYMVDLVDSLGQNSMPYLALRLKPGCLCD